MKLPAGWTWAHLSDIGFECRESVHPDASTEYELWSVPSFALGRPEIANGAEIGSAKLATQPNDILICKINPRINRVWLTAQNTSGRPQIASPEWLILRLPEAVQVTVAPYLQHYLSSPKFRTWITGKVSGVTGSHTRAKAKEILEQLIPLPPLSEQYRIVEALEAHLSRLDAASEAVMSAKRHLKPFTVSTLNRAALGRSSTTIPALESGNASRRLLANLSSKRFDYTTLPSLPEGWFWRRASDVCTVINSGSTPKAHLMHAGSGDIPFLKVYNLTQDGKIDFTNKPTYVDRETHENQLKRSRVQPGDVLTNIVGPPLGKTAVVPNQHSEWNINQAIVAFRAGQEVQPEWLTLILRSPVVLDMLKMTAKATAGQFNIALSTCRELPLPIPPMDVQLELVKHSDGLLEVSDRLIEQVIPISLRAKSLRQAILRRAFTGQLVPQDPTDEPASVLLDRIRAERATEGAKRTTRSPRKPSAHMESPPSHSASTTFVQQELPL